MPSFGGSPVALLVAVLLGMICSISLGLSSTQFGHRILKRSVTTDAQQILVRTLDENSASTKFTDSLRDRFKGFSEFGYSLMFTYMLNNNLARNGSDGQKQQHNKHSSPLLEQIKGLVSDKYRDFFSSADGEQFAESDLHKDLECVNHCIKSAEQELTRQLGVKALRVRGGTVLVQRSDDEKEHDSSSSKEGDILKGNAGLFNCSDETKGRQCIDDCQQKFKGAVFSKFLLAQLDWFIKKHCPKPDIELSLLKMIDSCHIEQVPQLAFLYTFENGRKYIDGFNKAEDDKQRCSVLKNILIDEFADAISGVCERGDQAELIKKMLQTAAGFVLAQNTEGAILKRCPAIYETNQTD